MFIHLQEGICGIAHKSLRMCKGIELNFILYKPKRQKPTTKQIRAQNKWRTSPNSNQITLSSQHTTMAQVQDILGDSPTKMGRFGCGRTTTGSSHAHLSQAVAWRHAKDSLGGFLFYLSPNRPQTSIKAWVDLSSFQQHIKEQELHCQSIILKCLALACLQSQLGEM